MINIRRVYEGKLFDKLSWLNIGFNIDKGVSGITIIFANWSKAKTAKYINPNTFQEEEGTCIDTRTFRWRTKYPFNIFTSKLVIPVLFQ